MDQVEEIRSRLSIEEVVGQYVQLKKAGRSLKGLCPFHNEKSPSFIVSPDKGMAYCFGCRKGGDVFAFIQEMENLDFPGALKVLAEKAGIELVRTSTPVKKEEKETVLHLMQEAQRFFQQQLEQNEKARSYLESRGYGRKEQQQFGIGYAPDSFHQLCEHLQKKGYIAKDILNAGMASQKEVGGANIFDRFRERVMFPIHDAQGKLVAFGGRTLSKDPEAAKYLNSPETDYYHKGSTLFCFHLAKKAIKDKDQAIVVEGYFDALTPHLHGYVNTVASLGTALTEQQIALIGRFSKNLIFAFDADNSGQAAASRSIEIAQKMGYQVSILRIPSGKDPDEAVRTAPEEWQKALENAVPAMDYEFQKALSIANPKTLEGKKKVMEHLFPILQRLPSQTEQEFYLKKLSFDLETSLNSLMGDFQRANRSIRTSPLAGSKTEALAPIHYSRAEYLLGLLLNHPQYVPEIESQLKLEYLEAEDTKMLYKTLFASYNRTDSEFERLKAEDQWKTRLQLLELYADEKYSSFSEEQLHQEVLNLCESIRLDYRHRRLQEVRFQLAKRERTTATAEAEELLKEHQQLVSNQF